MQAWKIVLCYNIISTEVCIFCFCFIRQSIVLANSCYAWLIIWRQFLLLFFSANAKRFCPLVKESLVAFDVGCLREKWFVLLSGLIMSDPLVEGLIPHFTSIILAFVPLSGSFIFNCFAAFCIKCQSLISFWNFNVKTVKEQIWFILVTLII